MLIVIVHLSITKCQASTGGEIGGSVKTTRTTGMDPSRGRKWAESMTGKGKCCRASPRDRQHTVMDMHPSRGTWPSVARLYALLSPAE